MEEEKKRRCIGSPAYLMGASWFAPQNDIANGKELRSYNFDYKNRSTLHAGEACWI